MRMAVTFHMDELGAQGEVRTGEIAGGRHQHIGAT